MPTVGHPEVLQRAGAVGRARLAARCPVTDARNGPPICVHKSPYVFQYLSFRAQHAHADIVHNSLHTRPHRHKIEKYNN